MNKNKYSMTAKNTVENNNKKNNIMQEYEGVKILTAKQAQQIAIKANKEKINKILEQIESAALKGESEIYLTDIPIPVIQYLMSNGFITRSETIKNELGTTLSNNCLVSW